MNSIQDEFLKVIVEKLTPCNEVLESTSLLPLIECIKGIGKLFLNKFIRKVFLTVVSLGSPLNERHCDNNSQYEKMWLVA